MGLNTSKRVAKALEKSKRLTVVEGEGSCFVHGHFFGNFCPDCEKQLAEAETAAQRTPALVAKPTKAEVKKYANGRMPQQKPHESEQVVGTPRDLLDAVEQRWGKITFDLAATKANAVCKRFYGPEDDSLRKKWRALEGILWLNPPFRRIAPWTAKAEHSLAPRAFDHLLMLVPASVGSNWFLENAWHKARIIFLNGRVKLVAHTQYFPKDLMILDYGEKPGVEVWNWRTGLSV